MGWSVIVRPVEANSEGEENMGGLVIYLADGTDDGQEYEVTRVAYARRASRNPDVSFEDQLRIEIGKAEEAAASMNELLDEYARQAFEKVLEQRDRIRDLLGEPEKVPA